MQVRNSDEHAVCSIKRRFERDLTTECKEATYPLEILSIAKAKRKSRTKKLLICDGTFIQSDRDAAKLRDRYYDALTREN